MARLNDDGTVVSFWKTQTHKAKRRAQIRYYSAKREATREQRDAVREFVFRRDGGCVCAGVPEMGRCEGPLTPHHLRKASAGGEYQPNNLVALCARMNRWVEDHPDLAWELGLVVRRGERLSSCWKRLRATLERSGREAV